MKFVEKVSNLIQGERYPNRTLLYEVLLPMIGKDKLFDDLDNELELVRDGQKSWESFVIFAKDIIQQIKEKYQDS